MKLDTALSKKLGLKYPFVAAPMFLISNKEMIAACAEVGILGCMPSLNARTTEQLRADLAWIRERTDRPIGINITLAVSLNLVNGYTGQFSLGHAGFMCIGAYTSAVITMFATPAIVGRILPPGDANASLAFVCAILVSGVAAALSGLIVGIPSLRLKGDYLAIVTLGFGEIIRIIFLNISQVGGARGLPPGDRGPARRAERGAPGGGVRRVPPARLQDGDGQREDDGHGHARCLEHPQQGREPRRCPVLRRGASGLPERDHPPPPR